VSLIKEVNLNLNLYQLPSTSSIQKAMLLIDENKSGFVCLLDNLQKVIGILTDGDIRRYLIKNANVNVQCESIMNAQFVWVSEEASREQVLKLLDHKIHIIPVLSVDKKLVRIISKDVFPLNLEQPFYARSKSPVRISFGGGGTDMTRYFMENGGAVLNATVRMYSHATLRKRDDMSIKIYSHDLDKVVEAPSLDQVQDKSFSLIVSLIKLIKPDFGFELEIGSDFPVGSGLGGSAVVMSAIAGCFNQFRVDTWDNYEIAEICFQAERLHLGVAGGWQDQYATVFGGHNFMEFNHDNNVVHPLRVKDDVIKELEETLILCYTGKLHHSGNIQTQFQKQIQSSDDVQKLIAINKDLTYQMKTHLLKGKIKELGQAVHQSWICKRQFSAGITDHELDAIYSFAMDHGSYGGKLLGAGGGGYFLFFVEPFKKYQLIKQLTQKGYVCSNVNFDDQGLQAWKVRF